MTAKPKILVVDDDRSICKLMGSILEMESYPFRVAMTGEQARRAMEEERFDILVSDIGMPDGDGYQLLAMIRAQAPQPPPAVALTAYATAAEKEHALRSGFQAHISKPIELSKLVSVIAGLVRRTG